MHVRQSKCPLFVDLDNVSDRIMAKIYDTVSVSHQTATHVILISRSLTPCRFYASRGRNYIYSLQFLPYPTNQHTFDKTFKVELHACASIY